MSAPSATPTLGAVPSGQSAPVQIIDATHHGAWVIIAAALGLTFGIVCLLIRVYVRVAITPPFAKDDYIHGAATALASIQSILVFWQCSHGFGTSIELLSTAALDKLQQAWAASDILFLIILYLAKCSLICLFLRLTPNTLHNKATWATFGLSTVWVIVSVFLIAVNCELNHPWLNIATQCTNMYVRWQIITALDIVIEVMLVCLSFALVHDLKMPLSRKVTVVLAFFFRLPLIAMILIRLHYLSKGITSSNPTLELVGAAVWTQIDLHYSNVAATIPCLRPFMVAVSTNYGDIETRGTTSGSKGYGSGNRGYGPGTRKESNGSNFILSQMGRKKSNAPSPKAPSMFRVERRGNSSRPDHSSFRPDRSANKSTIVHERRHDTNSIESNDSRKMIIKKEVDFRVTRAVAGPLDEELDMERRRAM